jgi:hypothetical protein
VAGQPVDVDPAVVEQRPCLSVLLAGARWSVTRNPASTLRPSVAAESYGPTRPVAVTSPSRVPDGTTPPLAA